MKKFFVILLCAVFCLSLAACAQNTEETVRQPERKEAAKNTKPSQDAAAPTPAPTPTPTPVLKSGMQNEAVRQLQQRLCELGYLDIEEYTEKFGPATERAVRLFQRQNGLSEDGIAGEETLARIYADDAKECALPLAGIRIGLDPGHQKQGNSEQEAAAPGSAVTKNKVTSGTAGKNTGTPEYQVNLAVALKLRALLEENGAEVVMTHETADVDISNQERARIMNDAGVDLALRLHSDGVDDASVHGAMMLVPAGEYTKEIETQSRAAGEEIFAAYLEATDARGRGVIARDDQTGFNWSTVPVCNIEMGCLSNGEEEALLISEEYQEKCAQGLLTGILRCFE